LIRVFGVLLGAAILLAAGVWLSLRAYEAPGPSAEQHVVVVPRASLDEVAALLAQEGIVGNAMALRLAGLATRGQGALKAGEFAFPAQASLHQVLHVLRAGRAVQHRLTIPEGLTSAQIALLFDRAQALDGSPVIPAEGMLLPETYAYERGTSRATVAERGAKAMERALERAWAARIPASAPLASPQEALVLASIVERETGRPEERPRVAAVFLNRLRRGMKLQSDPTVVYGASGGLGVLDHGITRAELDSDNPYNTYRNPGLPPGPISMPGLAALTAVTQPLPVDDLFFVADGTGGHVFARTEQEHARNVARWRDIERQRLAKPLSD
jgi:UPF0755 protein